MSQEIILTTGIYDLIKDLVRRKKVSAAAETLVLAKLKRAKQFTRKNLPQEVISIDTRVTIKNHTSQEEEVHSFVAPDKAKQKNKTQSILTDMGLAVVGNKEGDVIEWPLQDSILKLEIIKVEALS
jgi:regulator of nucleoside diphosphate kinase